MPHRSRLRPLIALTVAVTAALAVLTSPAGASANETSLVDAFAAELNTERAARRLPELGFNHAWDDATDAWSEHLATLGGLEHSHSGRAEIIGYGPDTARITRAFMASTSHRNVAMSPWVTAMSIGVACDPNGRLYVTIQYDLAVGWRPVSTPTSPVVTDPAAGVDCGSIDAGTVRRLYRATLGREPDSGGAAFWTAWLADHSTVEAAAYFVASPEFVDRYGTVDNAEFVDAIYRNVLGRAPDPGGRAWWLHQLDTSATDRAGLVAGFVDSAEMARLYP